MKEQFDPESFVLSPEELTTTDGRRKPGSAARKSKRSIDFYQFPKAVIDELIKANYPPALALAAAVYETWYDDFDKKNPVRLTSKSLKDFKISKGQKLRALKVLENTGQFVVERFQGKNPLVVMKWRLIKD